jgi:uncharacterized membrane protein YphA (DoxX/SURF4 family)
MHLIHNILVTLLALIFLTSGVAKLNGSARGLSGTRELHIKDFFARLVGGLETIAAVALIYSLRYPESFAGWFALAFLWCDMGGAIFAFSRANRMRSAFPAFFFITLLSAALVIS